MNSTTIVLVMLTASAVAFYLGSTTVDQSATNVTIADQQLQRQIDQAKAAGWSEERMDRATLNTKAKDAPATLYEAALRKEVVRLEEQNGSLVGQYNSLTEQYNGLRDVVLLYLAERGQEGRYSAANPITCNTAYYTWSATTTCQ